ncbi:MAG: N-acetylmuramoyl-L-alanine amidase [Verrucomicrobiota bacterium]|jgi:N-acetylmuramoyl-L-alanine amidase
MNQKFILPIALCLVFCLTPAHAAFINGQNYVPLAGWAHANGLTCHWTRRNEVTVTNRTTRLVFDVDSRNAEINGIQVALSFPIANQKGVALIAQFDLNTAVGPLLFPPRFAEAKTTKTICLDPGHGGKDTGNRAFWHSEKTLTLALAFELRDQLKQAGFNVVLTRTTDKYVELPDRPALANKRDADLFMSLHFNATETGRNEVSGPETYCITPVGASSSNAQGEGSNHSPTTANRYECQSLLFAYQIEKSLVQNLDVNDRGVRRARFAVLRDAAMPAILIECGYMTHPVEGERILDAAYRRQMAQAILKGILNYQKLTVPLIPPTLPPTNRLAVRIPPSSWTGTNKISPKSQTR